MTMTDNETKLKEGRVVAIAGPVVDIEFPHDGIPEINHAVQMTIDVGGESVVVTAEIAQQLGQRPGAGGVPEADRRPDSRSGRREHGPRHHGAGRRRGARSHLQRHR